MKASGMGRSTTPKFDMVKVRQGQAKHHPLLALLAPDYSLYIIIDLNQIALAPQAYN